MRHPIIIDSYGKIVDATVLIKVRRLLNTSFWSIFDSSGPQRDILSWSDVNE